jgi:hypothetical protein
LTLAALTLALSGCATPTASTDPRPAPLSQTARHESADIRIRLAGTLRAGSDGTLVEDPGWLEYVLAIENRGTKTLRVHNVKLLDADGRYLDSAGSFEQIQAPPDAAADIAGTAATRAAGAAAGQVIPYGGIIVGIISGAVSAASAESTTRARREFERRRLKDVELAPAGHATGSAFLPRVANGKALAVDYGLGEELRRIEIPLR